MLPNKLEPPECFTGQYFAVNFCFTNKRTPEVEGKRYVCISSVCREKVYLRTTGRLDDKH